MFGVPQYLMINRDKKCYLALPARDSWDSELWLIWKFIRTYENIEIISSCDPTFDPISRSDDWMDFGKDARENVEMFDMIPIVSVLGNGAAMAQSIVRRLNAGETQSSLLW